MEKQQSHSESYPHTNIPDLGDLKLQAQNSAIRDVDVGQMLEVHYTPEDERRVIWKLDLVYASQFQKHCNVLMHATD
jgi:hypothetical protein